jgi:hypothetical protein
MWLSLLPLWSGLQPSRLRVPKGRKDYVTHLSLFQTQHKEHWRSPTGACWINSLRRVMKGSAVQVTWQCDWVCKVLCPGTRTLAIKSVAWICSQNQPALEACLPATVILKGRVRSRLREHHSHCNPAHPSGLEHLTLNKRDKRIK